MALQVACSRLIDACDLSCDCDLAQLTEAQIDDVLDAASDALVVLTGLQLGRCEISLRPCRSKSCGCAPCCCSMDGILLPGFNPVVTSVRIDGQEIDDATYAIITDQAGDRHLERFTPEGSPARWPGCQKLGLEATEEGTFEVVVESGIAVNTMISNAAGEIACDLIAGVTGSRRLLPVGVISATVYGVTFDLSALKDAEIPAGLSWTIQVVGAYRKPVGAEVWSPEIDHGWRLYQRD